MNLGKHSFSLKSTVNTEIHSILNKIFTLILENNYKIINQT